MKLRNKKTNEIVDVLISAYGMSGDVAVSVMDPNKECGYLDLGRYKTLAKLNEEWEDYIPDKPLIKDEKIRKAVRAWADMNDIRFIHMCSREDKRNARIVGQNAVGRTFTMEINDEYSIRVSFEDYKECYTIAELCGEEEE